jgi:uncharacterized protein
MIRVSVALSKEGGIENLRVEGHAGFALKGTDIVCSAVTILIRTFARSVEASSGATWAVIEDSPGRFQLVMSSISPDMAEQYRGWCEFLLRGLEDLAGDEPRRVQVEYGIHSGRLFHGS